MLISLYLTRVVLNVLGVEDFGTYNVVGGVVGIITSINGAMSGAASRFISFALGRNEETLINETFSTIKLIHWGLAIIIIILGETIGLWFVTEKLVITDSRELAAMICYQCSLFVAAMSVISVPYNSLIIGHEKMDAFAYISILEAVFRLLVALGITYLIGDKLVLYSVLIGLSQIIIFFCYIRYCKTHFCETKSGLLWNKRLFREIASFAGWTFNGQLAVVGYTQGINILMNLFFGPVVNAARGVSVQIQNAAKILVNNFQIAIRPQMIKIWASGEITEMHRIIVYSTKLSYYLTTLTVSPLLINIAPILNLWLGEVPENTVAFSKIILYTLLVDSFAHAMIVSVHATGNIRRFQIWEGVCLLSVVPVAYILLKYCQISPESVMLIYIFIQLFTQIIRIVITLPLIKMSYRFYIINILPRISIITLFLIVPTMYFSMNKESSFFEVFLTALLMFLINILFIYFIGFNNIERYVISSKIKLIIKNIRLHSNN